MRALLAALSSLVLAGCTSPPVRQARDDSPPRTAPPPDPAVAEPQTVLPPLPVAPEVPPRPSREEQTRTLLAKTRRDLEKAGLRKRPPKAAKDDAPAVVADVFVLVGPDGGSSQVEGVAGFVERVVAGFQNGRFGKLPEDPILVVMFPGAESYERFCKTVWEKPCISTYGFYIPDERRMVMNLGPGIGTLSHELTHPVVEADFPDVPTWLNEGIASLYEAPLMPKKGEIHGAKNWRYRYLQPALATADGRRKVSLPALFATTDDAFRGEDESRHYAGARFFCQWLDEQGKLWDFYKAFRDGKKDDPRGEKAFAKVMGKTPEEANDAWIGWARSR